MQDAPALVRSNPPRRIAILRALLLGDLLVAVPALRAIRAGFPEAEITLIGLPWASTFVCRFARYLDRFVQFAGYPGIAEETVDPERTRRFLHEQREYGYDLVVAMPRTRAPIWSSLSLRRITPKRERRSVTSHPGDHGSGSMLERAPPHAAGRWNTSPVRANIRIVRSITDVSVDCGRRVCWTWPGHC